MLRTTKVSVGELRNVVKENSLENHFKELKSKALFEKFLLIPNKKDHTGATEQQKTLQEYEDIFFGRQNNLSEYHKNRRKDKRKLAVEELREWESDGDYKEASDSSKQGRILEQMIDLLFSTITDSQVLEKRFELNKQQDYKIIETNIKAFSKFLSEILDVNDEEFERRQHLMFLLAIKKLEGYEVAKPVWLRRKADEWGSKFVLRKRTNMEYKYITIMDGNIDTSQLKEGQTIGFNTHHTPTYEDANIQPKQFLELHILPTPALVGDELEEVFNDLLETSITRKSLDDQLKIIIRAMFDIYHAPSRIDLHTEKTADISNSDAKNVSKLYPRLFAPNKSDKVKDIFQNTSVQGLNLDDIIDVLVFKMVRSDGEEYIWVHCDEWARNCFVSMDRNQLNWLDFEDSVYIKYGDLGTGKIIKNGGRCWNRLASGDGKNVPLESVHLNAISSFARLFTATLQFYSVNDIYRDKGKLENYPDIIDCMFDEILDNLEAWANNKKEQEKGKLQKPELFNTKIKIQFLLACYDWAIHWEEHKPDKPHRSWSLDNEKVFNHFENSVIGKISKLLNDQEASNNISNLKQNVAKDKKAEDEKEQSAFREEKIDAYTKAQNLKKIVQKSMVDETSLPELIKQDSLDLINNYIKDLQYFLIKYSAELNTDEESSEIEYIDNIFREYERIFIEDVLLKHHDAKNRSHRREIYRSFSQCLIHRGLLDLYVDKEISKEWNRYYIDYKDIWEGQNGQNDLHYLLVLRIKNVGTEKDPTDLKNLINKRVKYKSAKIKLGVKRLTRFVEDVSQGNSSKPDFFLE